MENFGYIWLNLKGLIDFMINERIIREKPLFEFYIENNFLVINDTSNIKDNYIIEIRDIIHLEIIRNLSFLNKVIEVTFGFNVPEKSNKLRINLKNGFKDIMLNDCKIELTEKIIYGVNQLIMETKTKVNK